ncbi:MAG: diacylglycerol kinase family protein [Patescibacteria group bacterium]
MKSLIIFNPTAGLSTKQDTEKLVREKLSSLGYQSEVFYLDENFEREIASRDFSEIRLVVAVGGDGTVKVAARTILANKIKAPLAIIPFGSANVIAVTLGLPVGIGGALKLLEKAGQTIKIDVGLINKKYYFLVGASIGYISKVIVGTSKELKNRLGFFGYFLNLIFNKIKIKKYKFQIRTRTSAFWVKGNSLVVFNALNYFGLKPKKPIDLQDGIFNLYVFTNKTFLTLIEAFFYLLYFHHPPKHVFYLDRDYFKIVLKRESKSCQIDGDFIHLPREIEIKVLSQALEVVVGK